MNNRLIKQIIRGCGDLPHVGTHPGTGICIMLTIVTGIAASHGESLIGLMAGCVLGAAVYGPMYLYGAYDRANISDSLSRKEGK